MFPQALDQVQKQVLIRDGCENYIGGTWVAPVEGRYFDNPSRVTGQRLCRVPRSSAADIELALDAAHAAKDAWGRTSAAERAKVLNRIADLPFAVDHFRYFAGVIRAQESSLSEIDQDTVADHFREPLGAIAGCDFSIGAAQFAYWEHTQFVIDVVPGRGKGFSVEASEGVRFLNRSRVSTDAEMSELAAAGPPRRAA